MIFRFKIQESCNGICGNKFQLNAHSFLKLLFERGFGENASRRTR
jgi:hypothetical protein